MFYPICYGPSMKRNYTEIAFILDRSGSMEYCQDAAIEGFNSFLREQQQAEGFAKLTLVLFDDEYLVPVESVPVNEAVALTREPAMQPQPVTDVIEANGVGELGEDQAHQMTPRAECARLLVHSGLLRQFRHQIRRDKIANLPQHGELAAAWKG